MVNRNLIIILVIVVVLAAATFFFGGGLNFGEGEAPEVTMARQAQLTVGTPPPAAEVEEAAPSPAAAPEPGAEAEEPPSAVAEPGAAGEPEAEAAGEPPAAEEAADAETAADEAGEAAEEEEAAEPAAEAEAAEEEAAEEPAAETEAEAGEEAAEAVEEEAEAEVEAEVSDDPVENFKALDPRDIIIKKYEDLAERTTEPWDEEDPEGYIPNTGRVDPLTRVFGSVPDQLKPPRAGETDMNEISTYLVANAATQIVNTLALMIQCHNVIQIGLEEYATFSFGEDRFTLQEGQSTGGQVGFVEGIPLILTVSCTSISTSEVVLNLAVTGYGTPTRIEKNQVYIPRNRY